MAKSHLNLAKEYLDGSVEHLQGFVRIPSAVGTPGRLADTPGSAESSGHELQALRQDEGASNFESERLSLFLGGATASKQSRGLCFRAKIEECSSSGGLKKESHLSRHLLRELQVWVRQASSGGFLDLKASRVVWGLEVAESL